VGRVHGAPLLAGPRSPERPSAAPGYGLPCHLARRSLSRERMNLPLCVAAAATLAASPVLLGGDPSSARGASPAPTLRATLRRAPTGGSPGWLERTVCDRAAELGESCAAVAAAVFEEAELAGLDPTLVLAIIEVESAWDPDAVSSRDARGLMQLRRPAISGEASWGRLPSSDARDPLVNVRAGVRYYARLLRRFEDPELALVAYNAGPNRLAVYLSAEAGLPDRFWEYPRRVRREERRLRARLSAPAEVVAAVGGALTGQ